MDLIGGHHACEAESQRHHEDEQAGPPRHGRQSLRHSGLLQNTQHDGCTRPFQAVSNWGSFTVAVPMVPMAMAAASLATSMASRYDAPAEIARDRAASTVSPARLTS